MNSKNDEDVEQAAEKFFVTLFKNLERIKVLLKDELAGYFTQERLSLFRRVDSRVLGQEYDFSLVPPHAYLRKLALQAKITKTLMAQLDWTCLSTLPLSRSCYLHRLEKET